MASNPATVDDLSNRSLRQLSVDELRVGEVLLDDAWSIIVAQRPTVIARLDAPSGDPALSTLIVQIACAMVLRVLNNPDGKLEEAVDDYRWRRDSALSSGALYLSDAELALLAAGDTVSDGAFTIRPARVGYGPGYWSDSTTWVPL